MHPSTVLFIGSVLHLALLLSGDTYTIDNVDATDAAIVTYPRVEIPPCTVGAPNLKTSKREQKLNQPDDTFARRRRISSDLEKLSGFTSSEQDDCYMKVKRDTSTSFLCARSRTWFAKRQLERFR
ncbi:MAG: hypothetical protein NWE78_00315 [Candidatus Bathyarchaeota archaeon]|nr:hypothetical protein [Candidatus Bathyarchaeota archaeon]